MKVLFTIGDKTIYVYGVGVALGLVTGIYILYRESKRNGLDQEKTLYLAMLSAIAGILGARIYYIIGFNPDYYIKNPLQVFAIGSGGLSIQGALLGGILFAAWYARKTKLPFLKTADAAAPCIAIGQAIGRIGCDVYGIPMKTVYPWGVKVDSQILHPAQMYEMALDLILFTYLWRKRGNKKYDGELFIKYIIGFSINRVIVELFRKNPVIIGPFTTAHITSFLMIVMALIAGRVIKHMCDIKQHSVANGTVRVPVYQYALVMIVGAAGAAIYYTFLN